MNDVKKRVLSVFAIIATSAAIMFAVTLTSFAYEYTVTVSGGNQGTVTQESYSIEKGGTFTLDPGIVKINNDKYYLKGFHISGQETPVIQAGDIPNISEDTHLVATYGIKSEMVKYTVKYVDGNGKSLADPKTFYGNVGDIPVVAYTHIMDYQPDYYNVEKTLSANEADNVFTFKYSEAEAVETDEDTGTDEEGADNDSDSDNGNGADNDGNGAVNGNGNVLNNTGNVITQDDLNDSATADSDEIVNLDDEEVAKTDGDGTVKEDGSGSSLNMTGIIGIIAIILIALLVILMAVRRRNNQG